MVITRTTAERAGGMIRTFETPERAAHECRVQLQALGGYTDRALSRTLECLEYVCRYTDSDRRAYLLRQIGIEPSIIVVGRSRVTGSLRDDGHLASDADSIIRLVMSHHPDDAVHVRFKI